MRSSQHSKEEPCVFVAAKTAVAIPVAHELVSDALIQAALAPEIRAIEFIPTVDVRGKIVPLDAIVLRSDDGCQVLDIVETRPLRSIDDEGLALLAAEQLGLPALTLTAADVRHELRAGNCRLVWICRDFRVPAGDRVRILQALSDEGEMTLLDAAAQCRSCEDPVTAVLALVCADLIEADFETSPLGPDTRVWRRITNGDNK